MQRRPVEIFDETNEEHRKDFNLVIKTGSFGRCKNLYALMGNHSSILDMMRDRVCRYYLNKEFKNT